MKPKLDRTNPNRNNSAFDPLFEVIKSEKFRFLRREFFLFFCCYCLILIKLLKGSSRSYRTGLFNTYVNTGENRKNSDFRTVRLIASNPKETWLLIYSGTGTRARRKKLKTSLPLIRFLRSLDALIFYPNGGL
jgi:hypothetical protein